MGSTSQSSSSRPLTADERAALYNRAMQYITPYIPTADKYQGSQVIDPSMLYNRDRGSQTNYSADPRRIDYQDMQTTVFDGDRYIANSAPEAAGLVAAGKMTADEHYNKWGYNQGRTPYTKVVSNRS
jgi:hypothetical protein